MAGPFVYNIIAGKSGERAFDVKISDGNIVRIMLYTYIYIWPIFTVYTTIFIIYHTGLYISR